MALGVGGDAHGEVDGGGGVGERADRDEVDASFGVGANGFEGHSAGSFDGHAGECGADLLDGFFDGGGGHVIEQDGFGAAGDGLVELVLRTDFDLNGLAGFAEFERVGEGFRQAAAERDVVVLDEDSVGEIEPVVVAAATADSVFIERAEAGDGLARVEHLGFGAGDGFDEVGCERGDAGHALEQVEGDALGGEKSCGVGADDGDGLAFFDADAIEDFGVVDDFEAANGRVAGFFRERAEDFEDRRDGTEAGDDAGLFGENGAGGAEFAVDGECGGDVVGSLVFDERRFDDAADALALPIHAVILCRR